MARIKIKNLPRDTKVSKSEMANVLGGFVLPEEWGLVARGGSIPFFGEEPEPGPHAMFAKDHPGTGGLFANTPVGGRGGRRGVSPIPVPLP